MEDGEDGVGKLGQDENALGQHCLGIEVLIRLQQSVLFAKFFDQLGCRILGIPGQMSHAGDNLMIRVELAFQDHL